MNVHVRAGAMSAVAVPMGLPYFTTFSPEPIGVSAILCPLAIGSRTVICWPFASIVWPAASGSSAVATLSRAVMMMIFALID